MSRYFILTSVYAGTFLLWGTIPVCLFFTSEVWICLLAIALFVSILFGFLIKTFFPCSVTRCSSGVGYYLWGAGYWGNSDSEDIYCGLDKRSFGRKMHWFLIVLLAVVWGNCMIEIPVSIAKWGRSMMSFLFFYNLCMPLYGILWRSCFKSSTIRVSSDESIFSESEPSRSLRFPPIYYDVFLQWLWFYATIIALMTVCPGENFLFPIALTVASILLQIIFLIV